MSNENTFLITTRNSIEKTKVILIWKNGGGEFCSIQNSKMYSTYLCGYFLLYGAKTSSDWAATAFGNMRKSFDIKRGHKLYSKFCNNKKKTIVFVFFISLTIATVFLDKYALQGNSSVISLTLTTSNKGLSVYARKVWWITHKMKTKKNLVG